MNSIYYCVLAVLAALIIQTNASIFRARTKSTTTTDASGNTVTKYYCEYANEKYDIGTTWSYPYPQCFNCSCNSNGLVCIGYGISAGVVLPPQGCQLVGGTCDVKYVQISDPSVECPSDD